MREIKFKAWHKDKKCWISICPQSGYGLNLDNGQIYYNGLNITERIDLLQYTGLKDKNKKEIYEGDILKDEENFLWKAVVIDGGWAIECIDLIGMQCLTMTETRHFEIVGNIYENPELLEVE